MRINSIGANYSGNYAQKNKRILKHQQVPTFQSKKTCARFFSISLGGIGVAGTAGLCSVLDQAMSRFDVAAFSAMIGAALALYGYGKGKNLDETIEDGEKDLKDFKETHEIPDKK